MKRLLYSFAAVLSCALLLGGCVKDKGNYDYTNADAPKFDFDESIRNVSVIYGDPAEINPNVKHSNEANPDVYAYEWFQYFGERDLRLMPEETNPTLKFEKVTGYGRFRLRVVNTRTGIKYVFNHDFTVNAVSYRNKGYVYMVQNGADVDLEMMAEPTSGYTEFYMPYKAMISGQEGTQVGYKDRTGISITALNNPYEIGSIKPNTYFFTTDKGCDMLRDNTFEYSDTFHAAVSEYSSYANDAGSPTVFTHGNAAGGGDGSRLAMRWNGNWFWYNMQRAAQQPFNNAVNIPQNPDFYGAPRGHEIATTDQMIQLPNYSMMIMWSQEKRMFLVKTGQTGPSSLKRSSSMFLGDVAGDNTMPVGGDADFKAVVENRELISMGVRGNANSNAFYAVVKDPVDGYRVLLFSNPSTTAINKVMVCPFEADSRIKDAKYFACTEQYLYYSTGDAVYALTLSPTPGKDINVSERARERVMVNDVATIVPATLIPAGETVVGMKIFQNEIGSTSEKYRSLQIITKDAGKPLESCCTHTVWVPDTSDAGLLMAQYNALPFDPATNKPIQVPDPTIEDPNHMKNKTVPTNMRFTGLGNVVSLTLDDR